MSNYLGHGQPALHAGLLTPPSSPTLSAPSLHLPRTPSSPHKLRKGSLVCKTNIEPLILTPPPSPVKQCSRDSIDCRIYRDPAPQCARRLWESPSDPNDRSFSPEPIPRLDGPVDRYSPNSSPPQPASGEHRGLKKDAEPCTPSLTSDPADSSSSDFSPIESPDENDTSPSEHQEIRIRTSSFLTSGEPDPSKQVSKTNPSDESSLPNKHTLSQLRPLPIRQSSSPLRPGQLAARGRLLPSPRNLAKQHDRFIPQRRPPNVTRESFELNKPKDRLDLADGYSSGGQSGSDPFGRRLQRSGRLNEELRSLRATHSVISGRATSNRRGANLGLRRNPLSIPPRQVSAGAVWNVGGSSPANDTVGGVPNGRGGMLGSGTNAPLYTSMFLSRSDPDAELETYERRLALAFDVDQFNKVLDSSSSPSGSNTPSPAQSRPGSSASKIKPKHVWRDSEWVKEGSTRLFMINLLLGSPFLTQLGHGTALSNDRKPAPILPFRYVATQVKVS
jgi:hypothetical protein